MSTEVEARIRRRIRAYNYCAAKMRKKINLFAFLRLIIFVLMIVAFAFLWGGSFHLVGTGLLVLASAAFLFLMVIQDRCYKFRTQCETLVDILNNDLARATYKFADIKIDSPITFEDHHPFAHDLDFGAQHSLLKLIDNCFHHRAKDLLKRWINQVDTIPEIKARQEAIAELTERKRFRLKLTQSARTHSIQNLDANDLNEWLNMATPWTIKPIVYYLGRLQALLTITVMITHFVFQIPLPWLPVMVAQAVVFYILDFQHRDYLIAFMGKGKAVAATGAVLANFEKTSPQSKTLNALHEQLFCNGTSAGPHLKKLQELGEKLEYRSNGFAHLLLNGFFLWDQHQLYRLEASRKALTTVLPTWIDTIFKLEALSAVANYRWLYPGRPFPDLIDTNDIVIDAQNMAHPCISPTVRVGNDYQLNGHGRLHLITGSNMSGKSTFLRTVCNNLILARMGAPVCAIHLRCSLPQIWTSIKIQDSLAEGVSYFYAEVKRIKAILDDINEAQRPVFYALDEILKGTNSMERLIAVKAMAKFLIDHKSSGLITTHDLELLALHEEHPDRITKYHFQEGIEDDEMYFDYQLRPGELTSTNALRVMRFAKVPLEFDTNA